MIRSWQFMAQANMDFTDYKQPLTGYQCGLKVVGRLKAGLFMV